MAEQFVIAKAERTKVKLRIGLIGPSGSGKTYSALRLAKGIGGKTALIDTEHRRSLYYADEFTYDVLHLEPPFSPERFIEAIEAVERAGYETIIVDSASHEWAGRGGILEIHDSMGGNSFARWKLLTPRHNAFVQRINYTKAHMILTIRGKDVYVLEENDKGKQVPKKVGMGGEQRPGFEYEMTCSLMLDTQTHGVTVEKDNTHVFDNHYAALAEEHGKKLLAWAESGVQAAAAAAAGTSQGDNGKTPKDPRRQEAINEIAAMLKDSPLFSPEEKEEYRARIQKSTTPGVFVLKAEIAKALQERKQFEADFQKQQEAAEPAETSAPAPDAPQDPPPEPPAETPPPAAAQGSTPDTELRQDLDRQLAAQGWDDAPPGTQITGPKTGPAERKVERRTRQAASDGNRELDIY